MAFNFDAFKNLDPMVQSALIQGGMNLGGGILSGMGQGQQSEAQLAYQRERDQVEAMLAMMRERGNAAEFEATDDRLRNQAAGTLIGDPLSHQASRQNMALRRALLFDGPDGGPQYVRPGPSSTIGGYMSQNLPRYDSAKPFFTNEAMANAERPFWESIGGLTNGQVGPNLGAVGYGAAAGSTQGGIDASNAARQTASANAQTARSQDLANTQTAVMSALGGGANRSARSAKKPVSGWRRFLGAALPIAAGFIPGVGPLASMALSAGAGAAGGLISGGGARGALTGAAFGAGTGALNGALTGGGAGFAKDAINNTAGRVNALSNPAVNPSYVGNAIRSTSRRIGRFG